MKLGKLHLKRFTVFQDAQFDFSEGLNVLIGANATGKTHLMKLLHATLSSLRRWENATRGSDEPSQLALRSMLKKKLAGVFRPNDDSVGRLVFRTGAPSHATVELHDTGNGVMKFGLTTVSDIEVPQHSLEVSQESVFIPSREAFAMYEAVHKTNFEVSPWFDETYHDLCLALRKEALKGKRATAANLLVRPLEKEVLGGKVHLHKGRFYIYGAGGGFIEAPLVAEGWRKIASLVRLVVNGSLAKNGFLFWDEPEANLNPKLVRIVAEMLRRLAASGIQVFVATHDYLLTHELSLAAEYPDQQPRELRCAIRFFALSRRNHGIVPQPGNILADLLDNPILDEFSALYDRRREMFAAQEPGGRS
jgi:energy-coupling factor transporter ATP-binding protein EcfA2